MDKAKNIGGAIWILGGFEFLLWESTHNYHPSTFYWVNMIVWWTVWLVGGIIITVNKLAAPKQRSE